MKRSILTTTYSSILALGLCFAPSVFATTDLTLTGVSGPSLGGVFTSPYIATVNGQQNVFVICDDFSHDTYFNETWGTNVTSYSVSNLSALPGDVIWQQGWSVSKSGSSYSLGGKTLSLAQAYTTAAILAVEILSAQKQGDQTDQDYLSYALWALFDGSVPLTGSPGLNSNSTYVQAALSALYSAENTDSSSYAGATITVYDYDYNGVSGCGGCTPPPQEFLSVSMIEPSEVAALAFDLIALAGLVICVRRRKAGSLSA